MKTVLLTYIYRSNYRPFPFECEGAGVSRLLYLLCNARGISIAERFSDVHEVFIKTAPAIHILAKYPPRTLEWNRIKWDTCTALRWISVGLGGLD